MSLSGGLINWISHKAGQHPFKIFELLGELFTSGFVGIGIFMLVDSLGQPIGFSAASAGGHRGPHGDTFSVSGGAGY